MTGNDRFERNHDDDVTTHTGDDVSDEAFRSFAFWVNNPASPFAKHHVPEDLREAIHAVDDPIERQRLRAVVEAYERSELSPRDFVRLIDESDGVDYFDPLSTPEGWGSPDFDTEDLEEFREDVVAGGVTDKGRAPSTDRPEYAIVWAVVFAVFWLVAAVAFVVFFM